MVKKISLITFLPHHVESVHNGMTLFKSICNLRIFVLTTVTKYYLRVMETLIIEIWSRSNTVTQNYVCTFMCVYVCVCVCVCVCVLLPGLQAYDTVILSLVFSLRGRLGRNQSPVM